MFFKFIEIEKEGHKIPLFFGKRKEIDLKKEEIYKDKIEKINGENWNGNGKLETFLNKFDLKKVININADDFKIITYKSNILEFSIIEVRRTTDVYELLDYLEKEKVLEYLIHRKGKRIIYYILERR